MEKSFTFSTDEYAILFAQFIQGNLDPDVWAEYTIAFGQFWMTVVAGREGLI